MADRRQRFLAVAAVLAALLTLPAGASAGAQWTATETLHSGEPFARPAVAVAPDGTVTIAWAAQLPSRTAILAATKEPGGHFGGAQILSVVPSDVASPAISASSSGVVVAWRQREEPGSWRAAAAVRSSAGWGAARVLSADGADASSPGAGLAAGGEATVTWARDGRVQAIRRAPTSAWEAEAANLSPDGLVASEPQLAVGRAGDAHAIWLQRTPDLPEVQNSIGASTRLARAVWIAEGPLTSLSGGFAYRPRIAAGSGGRAAAVWLRSSDTQVEAVTRTLGGPWGLPQPLGRHNAYSDLPAVAVDGHGTVRVVWANASPGGIDTASQPLEGGWQFQPAVAGGFSDLFPPSVAAGRAGHAIAAWAAQAGSPARRIQAAFRAPGTAWGLVPELVTESAAGSPGVGIDDQGNGVVAWPEGGLKVRGYDTAGPELQALTVPRRLRAGSPGRFTVAPRDRWSAVGATKWRFGDGSRASGTRVRHAYARPGLYRLTVTSRDALGNASTAKRAVIVTPRHGLSAVVEPGTAATPRTRSGSVAIPYKGTYRGGHASPTSIPRRVACRGRVALVLKRGRRLLQRRTVRLDRRCRFRTTFRVSRRKLGKAKRLVVVQRFSGNRYLGGGTASFRVRVPRS